MLPMLLATSSNIWLWFCDGVGMHGCMLDLVTVQGSLNGPRYQRDILETIVLPHFDNHALAMRPVFIDDSARFHQTLFPTVKCKHYHSLAGSKPRPQSN